LSVLRAAAANLTTGVQQGAGTITMQVARNFFLTREKTVTRKLREVLLAWKIEASLSKDEILQLYVNQIFLGQRAYGFAAASQIYFGKPLKDVTVAEAAMLAGLPKAPSTFNPITNPKRAKTRQMYVLRRMRDLRFLAAESGRGAPGAKRESRRSRRYCDEIAGFPPRRTPIAPGGRPEMGILLRDGRRSHAGDYAIENTIIDADRRKPRGVRERRACRPRCGADGCRFVGEEGRSRQIDGMVSVRRAQRRV
jgi:hypothetical protein